ncbi:hypothetical protein GCM10027419_01390 [Pandoraea terrae]
MNARLAQFDEAEFRRHEKAVEDDQEYRGGDQYQIFQNGVDKDIRPVSIRDRASRPKLGRAGGAANPGATFGVSIPQLGDCRATNH